MVEIRHRVTGEVLLCVKGKTLAGADLIGATRRRTWTKTP